MKQYCINIDWFEIFTYEPSDCNGPEFYEQLGFKVAMREYGTRVFRQMFTLIGSDGHPWLEVRRDPASKKSEGGILDDRACSLRLVNRALYDWNPINDLYNFLSSLGFHYRKYDLACVSRVDLCVDFREDSLTVGEDSIAAPEFIRRYMAGDFWKIGPAKCQTFGEEFSDGMHFHALKFGSPSSMVGVKLYNKTLEMAQVKIKPYIIESWINAGLIENELDTSSIWRLEFSVTGNADQWIAEKTDAASEAYFQNNSFETFCNTANYSRFLRGLSRHYFVFAEKEEGKSKYRCNRFTPITIPADAAYHPIHLQPKRKTSGRSEKMLVNKLQKIRDSGVLPPHYTECVDTTLWLLQEVYVNRATTHQPEDEKALLRAIEQYNESLVQGAFRALIGDVSLQPELRQSAELCWQLLHRPFLSYARMVACKMPYSITAVRFLHDEDVSPEDKIRLRHLQQQAEKQRMIKTGEILELDEIPDAMDGWKPREIIAAKRHAVRQIPTS